MDTSGCSAKARSLALLPARLATTSGSRRSPRLVLVEIEFARDRDRVEGTTVGGGEDLRVHDIGAGDRAGARDDGEQPRMIGCEHGELGNAACGRE